MKLCACCGVLLDSHAFRLTLRGTNQEHFATGLFLNFAIVALSYRMSTNLEDGLSS